MKLNMIFSKILTGNNSTIAAAGQDVIACIQTYFGIDTIAAETYLTCHGDSVTLWANEKYMSNKNILSSIENTKKQILNAQSL